MPASPSPPRRAPGLRPSALGLILPLALCGTARADPRPWVDPPARPAARAPVAAKAPAPDEDGLPKGARGAATPAATADRAIPAPPSRPAEAALAARGPDGAPPRSVTAFASADRAAAARALAADYLSAVSAPGDAMLGAAPRFYGARVRFYGRTTTLGGLIAEKRSFIRRWPERRYAARAIGAVCRAENCTVRAVVDFRAASPSRGAVSRGAAELLLTVTFAGGRPVIVAETGRVLRRGARIPEARIPEARVPGALAPARGRA